MKADYQSYARAATVSLLGLAIQVALGSVLLVYGVVTRDFTAVTGSIAVLLGVAVWGTLAIVFDQHRRERIEALEAEALNAAQSSSVFESAGEELRVAARRLAWMHKYLVPLVSLLLGLALLTAAYVRFSQALPATWLLPEGGDPFVRPSERGWSIAVGLSLAVIGFIFARFVSGMAKQKVWSMLRGGAAYSVLASLIGLAMVAGQLVDVMGSDVLLRSLQLAVPVAIGVVGVEIFISLLLNLYRPRKAGDLGRAGFDSPVLGFISAPDEIAKSIGGAISYQVGVDITGSWAYRLLSSSILPLVAFGLVALWLLTCFAVVGPNEEALRIRLGRAAEDESGRMRVLGPGLHFKLPWPLESVEKTATATLRRLDLGSTSPDEKMPLLWTNDHKTEEVYFVLQATVLGTGRGAPAGEDRSLDIAELAVEIPLRFRVADLRQYERFAAPAAREALIRSVAQREVTKVLASRNENDLLGAGRREISEEITRRVREALTRVWREPETGQWQGAGLEVVAVSVEGVHPSQEAAPFYELVVSNEQLSEMNVQRGLAEKIARLIDAVGDRARAEQIVALLSERDALAGRPVTPEVERLREEKDDQIRSLIDQAGGKAGSRLAQAQTERWQRSQGERGRALAYEMLLRAYRANPELFKASMYLRMLREELADSRVYLVPAEEIPDLRLIFDLKDVGQGATPFSTIRTEGQ
jgi:membrane protease subunit HflK